MAHGFQGNNGERRYRDCGKPLVVVDCDQYHGEGKSIYFAYRPSQAATLKELRQGVVHVGVMIPNGNIREYPLSAVELKD